MRRVSIPTEDVVVSSSARERFRSPRSRIWDVLYPPETQMHIDAGIVLAGRLPGTPLGVGEIQFFVRETPEGKLVTCLEVIEVENERRALVRSAHPAEVEIHVETLLEDFSDVLVTLTQIVTATLPAGASQHTKTAYQEHVDNMATSMVVGLRRVLD